MDYIRERYKIVLSDFYLAVTMEQKNECLKELARLTALATEQFGSEFADSLRR